MARDWQRTDLGSVADWSSGGTPSKSRRDYWNGDVPWVSPKDMKRFSLHDAEDHISERAINDGAKLAPRGTVFIVVRGMILAHTFPVCIAERAMSFNQDVKALIPRSNTDGRFLAHWLHGRSDQLLRLVTEATHGTKRIELRDIQASSVELPDLPEQRRIAEILDTLDEAIRKTEQMIAKLKQVKQGLVRDLLTRGIDDNGELRDPIGHPEQFKDSPLGRIPKVWSISAAGALCSLITKGTTPSSHAMWQGSEGLRFLRVDNLTFDGRLDLLASQFRISPATHTGPLARSRCVPGDVLMNIVGPPLGKLGLVSPEIGEVNINQAVALFRPAARIKSEYLLYWLSHEDAQQWFQRNSKQTSGQVNLTLAMCQALPVPTPNDSEQNELVVRLAAMQAHLDDEISTAAKLRLLKRGLVEDLLTGRVRVTNRLDANDHSDQLPGQMGLAL